MDKVENRIQELQNQVEAIQVRNKRVEADKAWELSNTRTVFIAISTYVLILGFMILIGDGHPYLNALVASVGYLISTASYGILKNWWLQKRGKV